MSALLQNPPNRVCPRYFPPETCSTRAPGNSQTKIARSLFELNTIKLPDFLEDKLVEEAPEEDFGQNFQGLIENPLFGKLHFLVVMARVENETNEELVAHLKRGPQLNHSEENDLILITIMNTAAMTSGTGSGFLFSGFYNNNTCNYCKNYGDTEERYGKTKKKLEAQRTYG